MSSSTFSKHFNNKFLRDVNTNPELIDFMKTIERVNFHTNPTLFDIHAFVDFIYNFIEIEKLIESPFASEWKAISLKADGSKEKQEQHIKEQMYPIVKDVLTKKIDNKKVDNTFSNYIKRIICNVIGDVCGGFKITDIRSPAKDQVDAMQYIRDNKHTYMRTYITEQLFKTPTGGFVVCLENDHGCVFSGKGVGQSCIKNSVYKKPSADLNSNDKDSICYLQLDPTIHKANQAKGIYYTGNYIVNEVSFDDIKKRMLDVQYTKSAELLAAYKDRVSVCEVSHNTETNKNMKSFWYKKKYLIILHNKSVGTKKDIKKNAEEYACMRKLIDAYATTNKVSFQNGNKKTKTRAGTKTIEKEDVFVVGDFNLPLWGQDNGYLKLSPEDKKSYPIQETYEGDSETFMTKNLELYSTWDNDEVGYKDRTSDWMQNSQAGPGKRTIPEDGPRNYHTDMVFGNINLEKHKKPVILESKLHPNPNSCTCTKYAYPMVGDDITWFSDHQSMELTMSDERGEEAAFVMDVLNTLSGCCSGQQHMKRSFSKNTVAALREEFATLLVGYIKTSVSFDGIIEDNFKTLFETEDDDEETESEDVKQEEETECDDVKRNLVNDYISELSLRNIMTHTEYNLMKVLILAVSVNYLVWYMMVVVNWVVSSQ